MAQLLIDLNTIEQQQVKQWLLENTTDCSLRCLYDYFLKPNERERCAIEGNISNDIVAELKKQYGDNIKSNIRFF